MNLGILEARRTMNMNLGGPFGAVIVDKDNKVIAIASNTVLGSHDPTAHAEVNAIRKAGEVLGTHDLSGCTLYATGYPCPMCLSAIIWANIKEVYYGVTSKRVEEITGFDEGFKPHWFREFKKRGIVVYGNIEPELAFEKVTKATQMFIDKLKPDYIYKKIDSTIRGNLAVEILGILSVADYDASIIVEQMGLALFFDEGERAKRKHG